jgi:hypothetical protein
MPVRGGTTVDATIRRGFPLLNVRPPTATQRARVVQDTLLSQLLVPLAADGAHWMDHFRPFQASTKVEPAPARLKDPTATHAVRDGHAIPDSQLRVERAGRGAGAIDHSVPFQRSMSSDSRWALGSVEPTAVQDAPGVQDTSVSADTKSRLGTSTSDHEMPFHRPPKGHSPSTSSRSYVPRAMQALLEAHEVARNPVSL